MANFQVRLSEMKGTSSDIRKLSDQFRNTGKAVVQAANQMHATGWNDDAVEVFLEKIQRLDNWVNSMGTLLDQYAKTLDSSADTYRISDQAAAKNFR